MLNTYRTILTNKKQLTGNVCLFTFKLIDPLEINFIPGQYLILKVQGKPRAYSIASSSLDKNILEFIVELFPGGLASTYLESLKVGDKVDFQGPIGQFALKENNKEKIFLVTGTGIAPARSILISNIKNQISKTHIKNQKYNLFWGLKTYSDVYLFDELKQLFSSVIPAKAGIQIPDQVGDDNSNFKICLSREQNLEMISESDRQYFDLGHVDTYFEKLATNHQSLITNYEFYLCGGKSVVDSLKQKLLDKGVLTENIIFEKF